VNAEILCFRELKRDNRILALLIEGEPATSFPLALYEIRLSVSGERVLDQDEPLAADVRPNSRAARRWAKLRLLAAILDCRFDDLRQREQERQLRRLAWLTTTAIAGLVLVATLAIEALREKGVADQKTVEAVSNESAALTALADIEVNRNPLKAAKLALAAWRRDDHDVRPKLSKTLDALGQIVPNLHERSALTGHGDQVTSAAFSPDGKRVVTASDDTTARIWDAETGREIVSLKRP
jgi:hypothetical protein